MLDGKVLVVLLSRRLSFWEKGLQSGFLPREASRKTLRVSGSRVLYGGLLGRLGDLKGYISIPIMN